MKEKINIAELLKDCPKGMELDCIENNEIILKPKQLVYPKTQGECCTVLFPDNFALGQVLTSGYKSELLKKFGGLLICRDAYWKLYGEEMGLDKPWKPDWSTSKPKYVLARTSNGTEKQWETTYCKTFAFPTPEMRDAFYDNFKELIEKCKELL